jgi:hypothetical protein
MLLGVLEHFPEP